LTPLPYRLYKSGVTCLAAVSHLGGFPRSWQHQELWSLRMWCRNTHAGGIEIFVVNNRYNHQIHMLPNDVRWEKIWQRCSVIKGVRSKLGSNVETQCR
jgi:hypothetical protein